MRVKIFRAICCVCCLFSLHLSHAQRFNSIDPLAEKYPSVSPYAFANNNPIRNVDPDGLDWYASPAGDMMWRRSQDKTFTDARGVVWKNAGSSYLYRKPDGTATYFYQKTDDNGRINLASHDFTRNEMAVFGSFHSEGAAAAAMENHVQPSPGNFAAMVCREMAAQWTNPYLLTAGAAIGVSSLGAGRTQPLQYASRVRDRALQDPTSHNFPYSFDKAILSTRPVTMPSGYKIYQQSGVMNGIEGVYEIGVNPSGIIDHRFFRPKK